MVSSEKPRFQSVTRITDGGREEHYPIAGFGEWRVSLRQVTTAKVPHPSSKSARGWSIAKAHPGSIRRRIPMLRSIALATVVLSSIWASADPTFTVDCDAGQSLTLTLAKVQNLSPATVTFKGTCTEYVLVDGFNNLTLKGLPGATLQQPATNPATNSGFVLSVKASRSVTLSGFAIRSLPSAFSGLGIGKGSTDVLVQNVSTDGSWGIWAYEASQVWLVNVTVNITSGYAAISVSDKSDVQIVGGLLHRPADSNWYAGLSVASGHVTIQGMTIPDMQQSINIGAS